jgi:hypothetical protein
LGGENAVYVFEFPKENGIPVLLVKNPGKERGAGFRRFGV